MIEDEDIEIEDTQREDRHDLMMRLLMWREKHINEHNFVLILSFIIGICTAAAALILKFLIHFIQQLLTSHFNADSAHYTGDVLMNVGVIISMIVSYAFGFRWVDSLFALGVSFYLFYTSLHVFKQSLSILMDRELPLSIRRKIKKIAYRHPEIKSIHDLRTRNAGLHSFVQFHIEMKRNLTLEQTHQICDELETGDHLRNDNPDD